MFQLVGKKYIGWHHSPLLARPWVHPPQLENHWFSSLDTFTSNIVINTAKSLDSVYIVEGKRFLCWTFFYKSWWWTFLAPNNASDPTPGFHTPRQRSFSDCVNAVLSPEHLTKSDGWVPTLMSFTVLRPPGIAVSIQLDQHSQRSWLVPAAAHKQKLDVGSWQVVGLKWTNCIDPRRENETQQKLH